MKILQINAFCGFGSTGKIAVDIAQSLPKEDECYIAYGYFGTDYKKNYKILNDNICNSFKFKLLCNRLRGTTGYTNGKETERFLKWVENYNPDIIHLHNIHDDYIHINKLFSFIKLKNIPVVWTLHDCWPFTGRCAYFEYNNCFKWKKGCFDCKYKDVYPISYFRDTSKKEWLRKKSIFSGVRNLKIVTPSNWLGQYVKQSFLGEYDVSIIHNCIDTSKFQYNPNCGYLRDKYNLSNKKIILGVANSWSYRKGLIYFLQLSEMLSESCCIILIGLNDRQISQISKSYNNIIGLGRTESIQELVDWYSIADVYVNPTLEDNYPTTNLEAQACGTPLITFNTGGSPESLKYGLVVEERDVTHLKLAIDHFISYKDPRSDLARYFSKEIFVLQYYRLYKEILK